MRRLALTLVLVAMVAALLLGIWGPGEIERRQNVIEPHVPWPVSESAAVLHQQLWITDLHADSLLWDRPLADRGDRGHVDLPRLRQGNVALQVFPAVTRSPSGQNYTANASDRFDNITPLVMLQGWPIATWSSLYERAIYQSGRLTQLAEDHPAELMIVRYKDDLLTLRQRREAGEQVVGGLLAIEGAHALDAELVNVERLFNAGYRMIGLQHFFDNRLGGSLHGESKAGLTLFGKQVLAHMMSLGMMIDLAHSSEQVVRDVLAVTDVPLLISHTGTWGHCPKPRNISDALMVEIAARGGLIGIGYWEDAVCDASPAGLAAQIRAAVKLVGEDHVALGSDFDGAITSQLDASELAAITHELMAAGLDERQIRKVMGENAYRLIERLLPARR